MSIDLSQFHQVFFEESFENLDIMENSLMALDIDHIDSETINAIFRAAHSIKGGSATFGFSAIAGFTHILETLLDQVRAGKRGLSKDDVNLFLQSVDAIREMLSLLKAGDDAQTDMSRDLAAKFNSLMSGESAVSAGKTSLKPDAMTDNKPDKKVENKSEKITAKKPSRKTVDKKSDSEKDKSKAEKKAEISHNVWKISFKPGVDVFKSGNDPLRLIRELGTLGETRCVSHIDTLPDIKNIDPESCYFYWSLELVSDCAREAVEQVFDWVRDESDISIENECVTTPSDDSVETFWSIDFHPDKNIFRTGNDPLKILESLHNVGTIRSINVNNTIPGFRTFDPELCFLRWTILLSAGEGDKKKIEEIFEWVADDSDLEIKSVSGLYHDSMPEKHQASQPASDWSSQSNSVEKNEATESAKVIALRSPVDQALASLPSESFGQSAEILSTHSPASSAESAADILRAGKKPPHKAALAAGESSSIRVGIDKVDNLINMVGELVITQSMLGQLGSDFDISRLPNLLEGLSQLEQNTRELQESVMRIRMLPISFVFSRFPRMVRDLSQTLKKEVDLKVLGDQTELDKTVLEKIGDPLVHLVRNAVDHGIETPEERLSAGKTKQGTVTLNAYHQGGNVVIEVSDDGKGLNPKVLKQKAVEKGLLSAADAELLSLEQTYDLIFQPGFSTAKEISDVSGRGVGMDVVKSNIQALNGVVDIHSELGRGSVITIRLPLTLAILDGQLVRVANQTYIFPIVSIVESLQCKTEFVNRLAGGCNVFRLRDEYVPIIQLAQVFNIPHEHEELEGSLMVVVEAEGDKVGIIVDELLAQQQVVIKSLEQNYRRVPGVSGATILGDGTVSLIVDIPGLVRLAEEENSALFNSASMMSKNLIAKNTIPKNHNGLLNRAR